MKLYGQLFTTFAKIGVTTFGGGYAMLPMMQAELVDKKKWTTDEELTDYFAISQCTPGIIAVNTATFVGGKQAGGFGAICATAGLVFPSVVIIIVIAALLAGFADNEAVRHAFNGIRAAVCALIIDGAIRLGKNAIVDKRCVVLFLAVLVCAVVTPLSPIWFVVLAGVVGFFLKRGKQKEVKQDADPS